MGFTRLRTGDAVVMLDIETGTADQQYHVVPYACKLRKIYVVLDAAITGGNEILEFKNNAGASMGTVTITQAGSAAGDTYTLTPTANNTFSAGDLIEIEEDGGSSSAVAVGITFLFVAT